MCGLSLSLLLLCFLAAADSLLLQRTIRENKQNYGAIRGHNWDSSYNLDITSNDIKVLGPVAVLNYLGDMPEGDSLPVGDGRRKSSYNLNVGRALETLRRELPMTFVASNLDFSIFAPQIQVIDSNQNHNQHKVLVPKSMYTAAVKSLRLASTFSSIYPSMNVKKIEYLEDCQTIQCLVDVVLPDSVRIDGSAVWEGMFYFGLDDEGLISSHIFDRKVSSSRPSPMLVHSMPWLRATASWSSDLISGIPVRRPGLVVASASNQQPAVAVAEIDL